MATVRGRSEVKRFIAQVPSKMETVLRGAARAGANVVRDEAKDRANSEEVRDGLTVKTKVESNRATGTVYIKGQWANSLGIWAEYGTAPHFITVDDRQRQGMSANRINRLGKLGTLVINGKPVGATVHHPGAQPHPFLRVSLDLKESEAVAAAQSYINSRVRPSGIAGSAQPESDDA